MGSSVLEAAVSSHAGSNGVGQNSVPPEEVAVVVPPQAEPMSLLTIEGQGLSFEREVSAAVVLQIMRLALTGEGVVEERPMSPGQFRSGSDGRPDGRKEALAEFYNRIGPKKYPEKLITIAAYLKDVMGRPSFASDDLRGQFRAVNEPPPANMPRDFNKAVGEGWIAPEPDQAGLFYITRSGSEAVEAGFSADGTRKVGKPRRRRSTAKSNKAQAADDGE